jgi:hypothetical protein
MALSSPVLSRGAQFQLPTASLRFKTKLTRIGIQNNLIHIISEIDRFRSWWKIARSVSRAKPVTALELIDVARSRFSTIDDLEHWRFLNCIAKSLDLVTNVRWDGGLPRDEFLWYRGAGASDAR